MSRPHTVSLNIMAAIQQIGPQVTNAQLINTGGLERQYSIHTVKGRLAYLASNGFIRRDGKGKARRLYVTALGQDLLDNPDACDDALVDSKSISKPDAERTYEAKRRDCLVCGTDFLSEWPGERVCNHCKSLDEWKSSATASHVAQEVT